MRIAPIIAALTLALGTVGGTARGAEPLQIHIAWTTVPGQMTPVLFERKELAPHLGTSYVVQHLHFAGSGPMVSALATGEVDIAPLAPSSFGLAVNNAGLDDLRIVSDVYQDGVAGHYSGAFLVRADSPIQTIEDLKGKVLAVNAVGGGSDIALRIMLHRHGLEDRRDYSIIETQFPNMGAMLADRKVDLISMVATFATPIREARDTRKLFDIRDVLGPNQSLFNVARAGFLAKNRAALMDFFADYAHALRWFLAPENRAEAAKIIAATSRQPEAAVASYLFTGEDYFRDPNGRPNLDALQKNMDALHEFGFLATDIVVRKHADMSFLDAAEKQAR